MQKKNVLIVEDEEDIREMLKFIIEVEGYKVWIASNGFEALEVLKTMEKPCLIFLDLMMPIMDGWAFADAIAQDPNLCDIPFVVVTAFAENAHVKNAKAVLRKPVGLKLLRSTISEYCGK